MLILLRSSRRAFSKEQQLLCSRRYAAPKSRGQLRCRLARGRPVRAAVSTAAGAANWRCWRCVASVLPVCMLDGAQSAPPRPTPTPATSAKSQSESRHSVALARCTALLFLLSSIFVVPRGSEFQADRCVERRASSQVVTMSLRSSQHKRLSPL